MRIKIWLDNNCVISQVCEAREAEKAGLKGEGERERACIKHSVTIETEKQEPSVS